MSADSTIYIESRKVRQMVMRLDFERVSRSTPKIGRLVRKVGKNWSIFVFVLLYEPVKLVSCGMRDSARSPCIDFVPTSLICNTVISQVFCLDVLFLSCPMRYVDKHACLPPTVTVVCSRDFRYLHEKIKSNSSKESGGQNISEKMASISSTQFSHAYMTGNTQFCPTSTTCWMIVSNQVFYSN